MLSRIARALVKRIFTPLARALLRAGVSPDAVTVGGTVGVSVCALAFFPRGEFFWGVLAVTAFVFSDSLDGTMARLSGRSSPWGAFLDSVLDRVGDAAIFVGLALWFAGAGDDLVLACVTLYCLVSGFVVSYVKARAEGLGMSADVGIAERADRLVLALVVTGLAGLGVPYVQPVGLWILAVAATVTVGQRMLAVWRQASRAPRLRVANGSG